MWLCDRLTPSLADRLADGLADSPSGYASARDVFMFLPTNHMRTFFSCMSNTVSEHRNIIEQTEKKIIFFYIFINCSILCYLVVILLAFKTGKDSPIGIKGLVYNRGHLLFFPEFPWTDT